MKRPPLAVKTFRDPHGGGLHKAGLAANGQFFFEGHDKQDLIRQQAYRELGGHACNCLAARDYVAGKNPYVGSEITSVFRLFTPHSNMTIRQHPLMKLAWRLQSRRMTSRDRVPDLSPLDIRGRVTDHHRTAAEDLLRTNDMHTEARCVLLRCSRVLRRWGWPAHARVKNFQVLSPGEPVVLHYLTVKADPTLLEPLRGNPNYAGQYQHSMADYQPETWETNELVVAHTYCMSAWNNGLSFSFWCWPCFHVRERHPVSLERLACHAERAIIYNQFILPTEKRNKERARLSRVQKRRLQYKRANDESRRLAGLDHPEAHGRHQPEVLAARFQ